MNNLTYNCLIASVRTQDLGQHFSNMDRPIARPKNPKKVFDSLLENFNFLYNVHASLPDNHAG